MKTPHLVLEAYATYEPENLLSSQEIEKRLAPVYQRLKLPEGRLELMTGIQTRGLWSPGTKPSQIASRAAQKLIDQHQIERDSIDLLIHASVCRDFLEPATASVVHANLSLSENCQIFDLSNACLGVLSATRMAGELIEKGAIKRALIVSGENSGPLMEQTLRALENDTELTRKSIKKYIANLTIGSAGLAWLLTHRDYAVTKPRILGGAGMTDSSANHLCQGDGNNETLMMETDSEQLLEYGVRLARKNWEKARTTLGWTNAEVDYVIGHQVGTAHESLVLKALELDQKKTTTTYQRLGNTGSAALPLTLNQLLDSNPPPGSKIALLGIGSGLTGLMMGMEIPL
jgi:3-oxoacyl-[acyl-carrier-protein] synthase III